MGPINPYIFTPTSAHSQSSPPQHDTSSSPHHSLSPTDGSNYNTAHVYAPLSPPPGNSSYVNSAVLNFEGGESNNVNSMSPFRMSAPYNPMLSFHGGATAATAQASFMNPALPTSQVSQGHPAIRPGLTGGANLVRGDVSPYSAQNGPYGNSAQQPPYPTKADVFGPSSQSTDSASAGQYDFDMSSGYGAHHSLSIKSSQTFGDGFGINGSGNGSGQPPSGQPAATLLQQQYQNGKLASQTQTQHVSSHMPNGNPVGGVRPYANGIVPNGQGPVLHANGQQLPAGQQGSSGQTLVPLQATRSEPQSEEISTIFVVGFPDDMSEREFQNMFTFSQGFEAATLKIPNKETVNYAGSANAIPGAPTRSASYLAAPYTNSHPSSSTSSYAAAQDPYNLVTMNSGGVVVDGPQGTSSSWQQHLASGGVGDSFPGDPAAHGQHNAPMPPRKQIIGFAKFRSRQEALEARDVLQGRRVDIEKGSVLKAEMAKKNLHTKRNAGVGGGLPLGLVSVNGGMVVGGPDILSANGLGTTAQPPADPLSQREKELSVLGAMGLGAPRRYTIPSIDRAQEDGTSRMLPEDDQRRQQQLLKERENERGRRFTDGAMFEPFNQNPIGPRTVSAATTSSISTITPSVIGDIGFVGGPAPHATMAAHGLTISANGTFSSHGSASQDGFSVNSTLSSSTIPWNLPNKPADVVPSSRKVTALPSSLPPRPPSSRSSSPPRNVGDTGHPIQGQNQVSYAPSDSSAFSPQEFHMALPPHQPRVPAPRAPSPNFDASYGSSQPPSSSSSVAESHSSMEADFSRTLTLGTHQEMTSPQLPSPGSGASSQTRQGNSSDQNPPINTLYVGNLPNSTPPVGYPPNYLEESLRSLFARRPGYRKLCFRQKSNGPMCFVEFDDVNYAKKAMGELAGNNLNGYVKGGIRLSYSKNPLGVRSPPATQPARRDTWLGHQPSPQHAGMAYSSIQEALHPGHAPVQVPTGLSLELSQGRQFPPEVNSSSGMYQNITSSPPSRFFSPPPSSSSFGILSSSTSAPNFPRSAPGGPFPSNGGTFSPFGNSPPMHSSAMYVSESDERQRHSPPHSFSPPANGREATARVG